MGCAFVHVVVDDHSRRAFAEVRGDATTATDVLIRATGWLTTRGTTVERVLTDDGSPPISHLWRDTCPQLRISRRRTRPRRRGPVVDPDLSRAGRRVTPLRHALAATPLRVRELIPPAVATGLSGLDEPHGADVDDVCDAAVVGLDGHQDAIGYGPTATPAFVQRLSDERDLLLRSADRFAISQYPPSP